MAATESIVWQDVRDLLAEMTAAALAWDELLVTWHTESGQVSNEFARWSMISSNHYADPTDVIDTDTLVASQNTITNASVQLLIESTDPNVALDNLETVKRYITLQSTLNGLQVEGLAIMRTPGATTNTPYLTRHGDWIAAGTFTLDISFNTQIIDGVAVCRATRVQMNGLLDEEIPIVIDQTQE